MEEQMPQQRLFISHAAVDRGLAGFVDETARVAIPGIQVFRASRVGQIRAGREWFDVVTRELRESDKYMVLLTEASISKPWISFETGAAWYTGRTLVPLLAPGFNPQDVPEPLRFLQLLSLGDPKQAQEAFKGFMGRSLHFHILRAKWKMSYDFLQKWKCEERPAWPYQFIRPPNG
jgi:hypothetical protein